MTPPKGRSSEKRRQVSLRLRQAREYVGLTEVTVAQLLGLPLNIITSIESGRQSVEPGNLETLSVLYGRSVAFLLGETSDIKEPDVAFWARAKYGFSERDVQELATFAQFLKNV